MWLLIISILIDQLSKFLVCNMTESIIVIPKILTIEFVKNYGAVFGIMQGSNYILAVISIVICIAIMLYIGIQKKNNKSVHVAWYMILSGGIGNLIDRIIRGYVVDFIATPFIATFNIADSFVVIGVVLLLINEITEMLQAKQQKDK